MFLMAQSGVFLKISLNVCLLLPQCICPASTGWCGGAWSEFGRQNSSARSTTVCRQSTTGITQWHRTGYRWFQVRTLPVAPLWCDLGRCSRTVVVIKLRRTSALYCHYYCAAPRPCLNHVRICVCVSKFVRLLPVSKFSLHHSASAVTNRAEVRSSFIATTVRDESQVTPQGHHR